MVIVALILLFIYSPNTIYKMKWESADTKNIMGLGVSRNQTIITKQLYETSPGDCSSIPTEHDVLFISNSYPLKHLDRGGIRWLQTFTLGPKPLQKKTDCDGSVMF